MKFVFVFLLLGCSAFMGVATFATTLDNRNPQQKVSPSAPEANRPVTANKHPRKSLAVPKPPSPHRAINNPKSAVTAKGASTHQPTSGQRNSSINSPPGAARDNLKTRVARQSTIPRNPEPPAGNARHHGANPAIIGGPGRATTASLGGRAVSRKP